jgi:hypothetical protein
MQPNNTQMISGQSLKPTAPWKTYFSCFAMAFIIWFSKKFFPKQNLEIKFQGFRSGTTHKSDYDETRKMVAAHTCLPRAVNMLDGPWATKQPDNNA